MQENPRTTGILAVAKANNLDIELVETKPAEAGPEYKQLNKLGKIPTFVGADGFVLSECIAIYIYGMYLLPNPPPHSPWPLAFLGFPYPSTFSFFFCASRAVPLVA